MKIKKCVLTNFQKHSHLEFNFHGGINVITGDSQTGKTCIFRAIEWVCNCSNISEKDFRKEGSDLTSVLLELDTGFIVERIRSNTLNRYILRKDGCDDKVYDSFGKDTPEDIANVLEIKELEIDGQKINLNFAQQDELNFLFDKSISDSFKAKLFNKLTGNEVLDILFKSCNKDSLRLNKEIKETEEQLQKQQEELIEYSLCNKTLKNKLCMVTESYNKIKEDIAIYEQLISLTKKINQLNTTIEEITNKQKEIKVVTIDWESIKQKIDSLQILTQLNKQSLQKNTQKDNIEFEIDKKQKEINTNEKELKEIWVKCPKCPLCGQEVRK